jgi:hypothetical protein
MLDTLILLLRLFKTCKSGVGTLCSMHLGCSYLLEFKRKSYSGLDTYRVYRTSRYWSCTQSALPRTSYLSLLLLSPRCPNRICEYIVSNSVQK